MIRWAAMLTALVAVAALMPEGKPMPSKPSNVAKSAAPPLLTLLRPERLTPAQRVMPGLT